MIIATMRGLAFQAKAGAAAMRDLGRALEHAQIGTRRTRSGRMIYGLHPTAGPAFWTASTDKLARRRVRSRIAHRERESIGPAPAPYRMASDLCAPRITPVAGTSGESIYVKMLRLVDRMQEQERALILGATLTTDLSPETP